MLIIADNKVSGISQVLGVLNNTLCTSLRDGINKNGRTKHDIKKGRSWNVNQKVKRGLEN